VTTVWATNTRAAHGAESAPTAPAAVDGSVTVLSPVHAPSATVMAFTGHAVVCTTHSADVVLLQGAEVFAEPGASERGRTKCPRRSSGRGHPYVPWDGGRADRSPEIEGAPIIQSRWHGAPDSRQS
jgi:hypothetical protein